MGVSATIEEKGQKTILEPTIENSSPDANLLPCTYFMGKNASKISTDLLTLCVLEEASFALEIMNLRGQGGQNPGEPSSDRPCLIPSLQTSTHNAKLLDCLFENRHHHRFDDFLLKLECRCDDLESDARGSSTLNRFCSWFVTSTLFRLIVLICFLSATPSDTC